MSSALEVVIEAHAQDLAENTAARAVATLAAALTQRPLAHLVITGGSILEAVLRQLAVQPASAAVDWSRVVLWWGDERFVAADSPERNEIPARTAFIDQLAFLPENIHPMPAADGRYGDDLEAAAEGYRDELATAAQTGEQTPSFDLILLGVGPDGHCASLFPEHPALFDNDSAVVAVRNSPKPPPLRISLTFSGLEAAKEIWVIASGTGKADAVALALGGAGRVQIPSAGARGRRRTVWLIDRDAASRLPHSVPAPPVA